MSSEVDNIFNCPLEKHSCDFCEKTFDGVRLNGKVCGFCLRLDYRNGFCDDCKENLGEWNADWRMKLNIPREFHPKSCKCEDCFQFRWLYPCFNCGMTEHAAICCPWINDSERWDNEMYEYWDDGDRIEQAVRDDYIFGH